MSNLTIYKSNELVEAGYRLSLAEQRMIILSLGQIDSRDLTQKKVTLYAKDYAKEWGVSEVNAMREIKQATNRLFDRYITLKNADETTKFRWIQSIAKYHKGEARISFTFSDDILPFLFELDFKLGVTKYEFLNVSGFSSVYSFRLYELAVKMLGMKNQRIEVDELRRILQLEDKYQQIRELNRKVITPAMKDINEKSDLLLNIEPVKLGRNIVAFEFQIAKKAKSKKAEPTPEGTRKIHGVFDEIKRPQVAKGSEAEGKWATQNLNLAISQLRELGILKKGVLATEQFEKIPTEWLKVLAKYYAITDRYSAREINEILRNRT